MRKVHVKVLLDMFVYANDDADIGKPFNDGNLSFHVEGIGKKCLPLYPSDFGFDILDLTIESMEVTDSR